MRNYPISLGLALLLVSGCNGQQTRSPQRTQLEIRQIQTRTYETKDTKMVMKAMLNVLQDNGFTINQTSLDLGFVNATKEVDVENPWEKFWTRHVLTMNSITTCTVNISEFGNQTRVRVNFQVKGMTAIGSIAAVYQVDDPKFYQDFFAKVDKGIFVEKEKI